MKTNYFACLACLVITSTLGQTLPLSSHQSCKGVLLSDIHFDPFASLDASQLDRLIQADDANWNQPGNDGWNAGKWDAIFKTTQTAGFSSAGADANYPLMMSALHHAAEVSPDAMVICTGDLLRHDFPRRYTSTAEQLQALKATTAIYMVQKMQQMFHGPVIVALGNNDTVDDNYVMHPNSPLFAALAKFIKVVKEAKDPTVRSDFKHGGFYAIPDPCVADQDIVVSLVSGK